MYRTKNVALFLIAAMLLVVVGCETPKWDDPKYVNSKLQDQDRNTRSLAMSNVSSLKKESLGGIVPGLVQVYNNDTVLKKDAMKYLLQIRSQEAIDAYIKELETNQTDYAAAAAEVIGSLKNDAYAEKLIKIYNDTEKDDVKIAILGALVNTPTPALVPYLFETLKLDVDRRPIALLAYSCDILTNLAIKDPKAIDDATIKQVTLALFFANRTNQTLDRDCGLTIQAIGDRAIPELLNIYKGTREDIDALFMKYDSEQNPYPPNLAKLIAVQRLTTLRAKQLGPIAIEDLNTTKEPPKHYGVKAAVNWRMKEGQLTAEELYSLGDIKDEEARPVLEAVVKGERINKEWDEITDQLVELTLRQDASFGLVRLGNREALPALMEAAKNGVIDDMEKSFKHLAKQGVQIKDTERWQMNWMIAQSYANLALEKDRPEFLSLIKEKKALSEDLGKKIESMLVMFDTVKECNAKSTDDEKAACYGVKLKDTNPLVREKAAWELGRLSGEGATKVLNESLPLPKLDTREILTFDLYRIGNAESVKVIDKILEDEAKKGASYALDHYRLKLARLWLINNRTKK